MKKTTINITEDMERQVDALIARAVGRGARLGMADIVRQAVAMMHEQLVESGADYAPTYTEVFIHAKANEMRIPVVRRTEDGAAVKDYLKRAETLEEALAATEMYVEVKHPLRYPLARYDYQEDMSEVAKSRFAHVLLRKEPRRFARAAVIFTPKMALI